MISNRYKVVGVVGKNNPTGTIVSYNIFHSNADAVGKDWSKATANNTRVYNFDSSAGVTYELTSGETITNHCQRNRP